MENKKYQLYLFALKEETMREAMKERFNRVNSKYILVYTDNLHSALQNTRYHVIDEDESKLLSDSEKLWLLEANVKIITEESLKREEEIARNFGKRLEILEKELEAEAKRLPEGAVDSADE